MACTGREGSVFPIEPVAGLEFLPLLLASNSPQYQKDAEALTSQFTHRRQISQGA